MIFGVASIAGAWITDKLMVKLQKKVAWIIAVGLEGIVMVVMIGFIIHPGNAAAIYAVSYTHLDVYKRQG